MEKWEIVRAIYGLEGLTITEKSLLIYIYSNACMFVRMSNEELGKALGGLSKRQIINCLNSLSQKKLIYYYWRKVIRTETLRSPYRTIYINCEVLYKLVGQDA